MIKKSEYPTIKEVIEERVRAYKSLNMPTLEQFLDSESTSRNTLLFRDHLDENFVKTSSGVILRANGRGNQAKFVQHHPQLYKCYNAHHNTKKEWVMCDKAEYDIDEYNKDYNGLIEKKGDIYIKPVYTYFYSNIPLLVDYDSSDGIEFSLKGARRQYKDGGMWMFRFFNTIIGDKRRWIADQKSRILNTGVWNAFVEGDKTLLRAYRDMVFEFSSSDSSMSIDIDFPSPNYGKFDTLWPIEIGGIRKNCSEIRM